MEGRCSVGAEHLLGGEKSLKLNPSQAEGDGKTIEPLESCCQSKQTTLTYHNATLNMTSVEEE